MSFTKQNLLNQISSTASDLAKILSETYSDQTIITSKLSKLEALLEAPELDADSETVISRCPGRISLSKHADYINSDLLYLLDDRDIFLAGQLQYSDEAQIILINSNHNFPNIKLKLSELNQHLEEKTAWYFYPLKIIDSLGIKFEKKTLVLNYSSDLPTGSGLSSSHALMLSSYFCLAGLFSLKSKTDLELIKFCQEIESQRGFKSGLGDQSAQLLCKKGKLSFIKLYPELKVEYRDLPENLAVITAPSFIKADKSLPEFSSANESIKKYKSINELVKDQGVEFLADLLYKKSEKEIYQFLESITDPKLQALALYGLAEAARVKDLKENGISLEKLGKHLELSHQAEKRFKLEHENWLTYHHQFKLDTQIELKNQSGYYGASTLENDQLQALALSLEGVYGSSISGAGLGGNNLILCHPAKAKEIKTGLINAYYASRGLEDKALERVHLSSFSVPCKRLI